MPIPKKPMQPFSYYGGKQRMSKYILPYIPYHRVYVEPFAGGASVFWRKGKLDVPEYIECLNDLDKDLINFYRQLQCNGQELERLIILTPFSRAEYRHCCATYRDPSLSEVERARRYYTAVIQSYNSTLCNGFNCGTPKRISPQVNTILRRQHVYKHFTERMQGVHLEYAPALQAIETWDSLETFFYLDPPYPKTPQKHYKGYTQNDLIDLCDKLKQIKGKFILSCYPNDAPCDSWHKLSFDTISCASRSGTKRAECLWMNYAPESIPC